jgi:hypothetical protein
MEAVFFQSAVLDTFVTMEKVLVNDLEISSITTGFPVVFLSPFIQQLVLLSQKHNTNACAHVFSNQQFAIYLKFCSSDARLLIHRTLFPTDPPTVDASFPFEE